MQPEPSAVWNTPRAGDAWQIRRSINEIKGAAPAGAFCLATAQISPAGRPLAFADWNGIQSPSASGHPGQRWGEVKGRRFFCRPLTFPHRTAGNCMHLFTDL